ncbi:hypothetical protein FRC06_010554 [Ceratobasidium sp. 370]|nr:hypothetical protein FRC06_010554 [Ceratobasidium sp. 370]
MSLLESVHPILLYGRATSLVSLARYAPSSPLSEDETTDEDDERRGVGRGRAPADMNIHVEVRPRQSIVPTSVSETSSHPFPFRTGSRPPPTLKSYSTRADARVLHSGMEIYLVNSPPAPKTVFGPAPPSSGPSGKWRRGVRTSPMVRTKKLVQTKSLTSPGSKTRPLPSPAIAKKKASVLPVQSTVRLPAVSIDSGAHAPLPLPTPAEPDVPASKIRCVCRSTQDDRGRTIVCDGCGFRQHARCYGLDGESDVGRRWMCGMCEGGPGGWRKGEDRAATKEAKEVELGERDVMKDMVGTVMGHDLGEGDVGKEPEVGMDQVAVGKELVGGGMEGIEVGKELMEAEKEVVAARGLEDVVKVGPEDAGPVWADAEMKGVGLEQDRLREPDTEKGKEVVADSQPGIVKVC